MKPIKSKPSIMRNLRISAKYLISDVSYIIEDKVARLFGKAEQQRSTLAHELGHAYASLSYGVRVVGVRTGSVNGGCCFNARCASGWDEGVNLVAGLVFQHLYLKERGIAKCNTSYEFVATNSWQPDIKNFNSLETKFPDEPEYIKLTEAINIAEELWYSGGREFANHYIDQFSEEELLDGDLSFDIDSLEF